MTQKEMRQIMKTKEEMTLNEKIVRKIIIDYRNDYIGGLENAFLDMGENEEEFIKVWGVITKKEVCDYIYSNIMRGKDKYLVSPINFRIAIEKKHIKFMGKEFIEELIEDRVEADYKKHGWIFPHQY